MRLEDELADAMEAHVADVRATPSMGAAIRRRHRAHRTRFRTAGAALVTAAVAGAVPVYLAVNAGPAAAPGPAAGPTADARATQLQEVAVPKVVGMPVKEAVAVMERAGLGATVEGDGGAGGRVAAQDPAAGQRVPAGHGVVLTSAAIPDPSLNPAPTDGPSTGDAAPKIPDDLGDLGDGRKFGGVEFGYLPEGLKWGEGSVKDGFGATSYSTWWVEAGLDPGMYSVQAVVYRGGAATQVAKRMKGYREQGARPVGIDGKQVYIVRAGEAADRIEESGTPTAVWTERRGLAVEVMLSPDYATKLTEDGAEREMRKIIEGLAPTE
ncbi:PASTA domain-containing protein [Planomonospora sp. ID67723]|uniref:PASTA domain-containing protein n=1 Tax=Planomonospora sp. ID67723 TaxID=2738134 RepID=UPI0018C3A94A|nr:PASTA domain-containing protein [Planomonospora sp. ID67723]MBG0827705.1 PASTA domain-containing protein [Planomonospora sp. ID67723]